MKQLILLISVLCCSLSSMAIPENAIHIQTGFGLFSSRGMAGASVDKFFTPNHALTVAGGVDIIGASTLLGYKYFGNKANNSQTFWDKCFFFIECDQHAYGGLGLQYAGASKIRITETSTFSPTEERDYDTKAKWLGMVMIGSRYIFKSNVTFDAEVSYRHLLSGGEYTQTTGLPANDNRLVELGYRTFGVSLALGYQF